MCIFKQQAELCGERAASKYGEFIVYYLVSVPIAVKRYKPIYIRSTNSSLCVDKTQQHYCFSSELELQKCKEPTTQKYVC